MPKELIEKLREHPYVAKATEWSVSFTPEFKRLAYEEYHSGKPMREIFTEAGFDVEELGSKRLENFRNKLCERADDSFEDRRRSNSRKEPQSTEAQLIKRIRELEHRNAYLEQENAFLKKIRGRKTDGAK